MKLLQITPVLIFPYAGIGLFVISYFVYQKYQIIVEIRNVPFSTILPINLKNMRKNLQIKSMIYNFILALSLLDFSSYLFWSVCKFFYYDVDDPKFGKIHTNNTCKSINALYALENVDEILISLIPTILCLFFIVLRRAFLNLPYTHWVKGYTVYILAKSVFLFLSTSFSITYDLFKILIFPFVLIDMCVYISSSRSFYLLLKGRRDEARWHSTLESYKEKRGIVRSFFLTTTYTVIILAGLLIVCALDVLNYFLRALRFPCLLNYETFGYLAIQNIPKNIDTIIDKMLYICQTTQNICGVVVQILLFLSYLYICIYIVVRLLIRRWKFNHVNEWITRPLMERYRANLGRRSNHFNQPKTPFILAFRSTLIY